MSAEETNNEISHELVVFLQQTFEANETLFLSVPLGEPEPGTIGKSTEEMKTLRRTLEITPEKPVDAGGGFTGFFYSKVIEIAGRGAALELYRIDHALLEYGVHWRWVHGAQFYTVAGLAIVVEEFKRGGLVAEGIALHAEISKRVLPRVPAETFQTRRWDLREALA